MKCFFIKLIRIYQKEISPTKPPRCRFYPTCSQYAVEAVERFGVLVGGILTVLRLLRCTPFFKGGFDPVPEKISYKNFKDICKFKIRSRCKK